jgi:hypothetical protein
MKWLKEFRNWFNRGWQNIAGTIAFEWNSWMNSIRFKKAKRKADKLHKRDGKRYHVIPDGNQLIVVNNESIKVINRGLPKAKRLTIIDLLKLSYYSTSVESVTRKSLK